MTLTFRRAPSPLRALVRHLAPAYCTSMAEHQFLTAWEWGCTADDMNGAYLAGGEL